MGITLMTVITLTSGHRLYHVAGEQINERGIATAFADHLRRIVGPGPCPRPCSDLRHDGHGKSGPIFVLLLLVFMVVSLRYRFPANGSERRMPSSTQSVWLAGIWAARAPSASQNQNTRA
jgi:hypothetical protein